MSKKKSSNSSSLKKLSQAGDKPSLQQKKPGKLGKEIDDIFGGGKNKKPSQAGVKPPATVQTKPGKIGKEIDDIFGGRKKKKNVEAETSEKEETPVKKAGMAKRKRKRSDLDGFNNKIPKSGRRKRTEDGLLVFTEDELGINKANAGNTPLCPFDCHCCF